MSLDISLFAGPAAKKAHALLGRVQGGERPLLSWRKKTFRKRLVIEIIPDLFDIDPHGTSSCDGDQGPGAGMRYIEFHLSAIEGGCQGRFLSFAVKKRQFFRIAGDIGSEKYS